ncbi:MAG: nicotinate (nicotinamide) nucleotide adenylyltransferase [Verrucomicrobiales bacterium]
MQSSAPPSPARRPRYGLFGGSFDPVHLGHTAMAEAARTQANLEKIIFLPAAQSPHKTDSDPPAPAVHRLAMLELALADLPWAEVSRWEIDRPGPSYSWKTVEHCAAVAGPNIELCWILGADQWDVLLAWSHPEKLAALLTFLVFPRGDTPVLPRPGFRHQPVICRHPASSTAARAGQSLDHLVAPEVAAYIRKHALYPP